MRDPCENSVKRDDLDGLSTTGIEDSVADIVGSVSAEAIVKGTSEEATISVVKVPEETIGKDSRDEVLGVNAEEAIGNSDLNE